MITRISMSVLREYFYKCCVVTLFILSLLLPSEGVANNSLTFATHTRAPLSLFLQEILQQALKPYNKSVSVVEMPGRRVIQQVNSGVMIGDAARIADFKLISNDDTSNYLRVNEAVALTRIVMITKKSLQIEHPSWYMVNQGSVAYLRGSMRLRLKVESKNRVPVSTSIQALKMLARDRVRSVVMFEDIARKLIRKESLLSMKLVIHSPKIDSFNLYTYIHKDHAELVPLLEESLKEIKRNGIYKKIADKYHFTMTKPLGKTNS